MLSRLLAPIGVVLLMGGMSSAVSVRPLSLQELSAGAHEVVFGRVVSVDSAWVGQKIETTVIVTPYETWKGSPPSTVRIKVPGGTVGGVTMKCAEAPLFRQNDDVVCFLRNKDSVRTVYGWFRGQYTVVGTRVREIPNMTVAGLRATVQTALVEDR